MILDALGATIYKYLKLSPQQTTVIMVHVLAVVGLYYLWDPWYLLVFYLGNRLIMGIGHDIGMHRYFSHRSFKTSRPWEYVFLFLNIFTTHGSPLVWVATHRIHHGFSDQPGDPHPSKQPLKTWFWFFEDTVKFQKSGVKDLLKQPGQLFVFKHYLKLYWGLLGLFTVLFGAKFVLYFFILNGVVGFHTAGLINICMHRWGYRSFETTDLSRNNWWSSVIHLGAGWHNNHHKFPNSYTYKVLPWEFDPSAWIIKNIIATNKDELVDLSEYKDQALAYKALGK